MAFGEASAAKRPGDASNASPFSGVQGALWLLVVLEMGPSCIGSKVTLIRRITQLDLVRRELDHTDVLWFFCGRASTLQRFAARDLP